MENTDWVTAWEDAQHNSPNNVRAKSESLWMEFWGLIARDYLRESIDDERFYRGIVEYLGAKSVFRNGDRVLDIGCGPGTYTLLFAETARDVDALDPSTWMLNVLLEEAKNRGLHNIGIIRSKWENFVSPEKYGLVFSSMSPAINDARTLLKMEKQSSRSCCIITYGGIPSLQPRKDLWELLIGEYRHSNAYLYIYPYNVLRQMGRDPTVKTFCLESTERVPLDDIIKRYVTYFSIFMDMDEVKKICIRDYFEALVTDGFYERKTKDDMAVIYWDIPGGV